MFVKIDFHGCPTKYLTQKFCQIEIFVQVLLIKQLSYVYLFILLQKQLNAVRPIQYVKHAHTKPFPIDNALCDGC